MACVMTMYYSGTPHKGLLMLTQTIHFSSEKNSYTLSQGRRNGTRYRGFGTNIEGDYKIKIHEKKIQV